MTTIRKRTYGSKNSFQDVLTRVQLDVGSVMSLTNPMMGNLTVDTNKPWVGKIDESEGTFEIIQTNASILPLRFLEGNFFDLFVQGEISVDGDKTEIDVRFKLGFFYAFFFLLTFTFSIISVIQFIDEDNWDNVKGLIFLLIVFNVIPTLLLIVQLNRIENEVADLLGAE